MTSDRHTNELELTVSNCTLGGKIWPSRVMLNGSGNWFGATVLMAEATTVVLAVAAVRLGA